MTREYAIDSLGYGMFANNSELIHDIFNYFENEVKTLNVAIKIYEGALESSSQKQSELQQNIKSLEAQLANTEQLTCDGCKWQYNYKKVESDEGEIIDICYLCERDDRRLDKFEQKDTQ